MNTSLKISITQYHPLSQARWIVRNTTACYGSFWSLLKLLTIKMTKTVSCMFPPVINLLDLVPTIGFLGRGEFLFGFLSHHTSYGYCALYCQL